jgi:glycoprotein endo-alpha-1,2-mannosidase
VIFLRVMLLSVGSVLIASSHVWGAPTVGAYYYPWYGPGAGGHHYNHTLRMHTTPEAQEPALGEYNSRDPNVISTHIDQSHVGNISMWSLSWWGPNSYEDITIRNHIFAHPRASELKYTIHYETSGRLGDSANPNYGRLESDFRYLAENVFDDPNYMRVDGRPVVVMYLSRVYMTSQPGWNALANVRSIMQNEYGYDPYIIGDHFFGGLAAGAQHLDAVTTFDVYGQAFGSRPTNLASLNRLEGIYNGVQDYVDTIDVDFVPGLAPGYNDTAVRSGNAPSPRYLLDSQYGPNAQGSLMSEMLDRVVLPHTDSDILDLLMVNSFNEWHEDTQIEPTIISPRTSTDDTPSGMGYTAGYHYEGYGNLYLDILRDGTLPASAISADFDDDGDVDGKDFLVWQRGLGLNGQLDNSMGDANSDGVVNSGDLEVWQEQFGETPLLQSSLSVPEPSSLVLASITATLLSLLKLRSYRIY